MAALHPIGARVADALVGSGETTALDPQRWPAAREALAAALTGPQARASLEAISVLVGLLLEDGATRAAHALVAAVRGALPDAASAATVARYRAFGGVGTARATAEARIDPPGERRADVVPAHRLAPPRPLR